MSQGSIVHPTSGTFSGLEIVQFVNAALATLATNSSGAADPGPSLGPFAFWADAGNNLLKQRTAANDGWVTLGPLLVPIANQVGFQQDLYSSAIAAGTADAITANFTPAFTAATLTSGCPTVSVRATAANATTTPTFTPAPGVIAAAAIVKGNGLPLAASDIAGAGHWITLQWDATLSKWMLLNPATGVTAVTTVTPASDPTFADSSAKAASTSWLRGAMSAIATAAGFACSLGTNGYLKLPSWLGGVIFQWGTFSMSGANSVTVTFPIAFPTACGAVFATDSSIAASSNNSYGHGASTPTQVTFWRQATATVNGEFFAIGR